MIQEFMLASRDRDVDRLSRHPELVNIRHDGALRTNRCAEWVVLEQRRAEIERDCGRIVELLRGAPHA